MDGVPPQGGPALSDTGHAGLVILLEEPMLHGPAHVLSLVPLPEGRGDFVIP